MKTYYKIFPIILILLTSWWRISMAQEREMQLKPFDYDIAVFPSSDPQNLNTDVYVWVGNYQLQFLKTDTIYTARYQVNVEIFKQKNVSLLTRDTTNVINEQRYARTIAHDARHLVLFRFNLAPQEYVFRIRLLDLNSNATVFQEVIKKVPALSQNQLGISDILIMAQDSISFDFTTIPPMRVPIQDRIFLYTQVILPPNVTSFDLDASLLPKGGAKPSTVNKKFTMTDTPGNVVIKLDRNNMARGENDLTVKITAASQTAVATKKIIFISAREQFTTGRSLDEMIEQMSYIAYGDDLKKMRNAIGEEKENLFQEFWDKRNPVPNSKENPLQNEFFKRVELTNKQFSYSKTPGWKTDRGRVYIIYGAPDNVDKSSTSSGMGNYEVWYYNDLRQKFVFYDEYGFGEYRLVSGAI